MFAKQKLTESLRRVLRNAEIVATPMPLTPEIRLYLLGHDYRQEALTDEERAALMEEPPFWAFCWSSGQVLAKWIRDSRKSIYRKRILDFGAGSGITAIAAALSGAREVIALDTDPLAREAILANAELNSVTITTAENFDAVKDDFDVILAADTLYDRNNLLLLNIFTERARLVIVADSRVKKLSEPYAKIGHGMAVTCPDLDEPEEYRHVCIFTAHS